MTIQSALNLGSGFELDKAGSGTFIVNGAVTGSGTLGQLGVSAGTVRINASLGSRWFTAATIVGSLHLAGQASFDTIDLTGGGSVDLDSGAGFAVQANSLDLEGGWLDLHNNGLIVYGVDTPDTIFNLIDNDNIISSTGSGVMGAWAGDSGFSTFYGIPVSGYSTFLVWANGSSPGAALGSLVPEPIGGSLLLLPLLYRRRRRGQKHLV
jgi:hypothetical protein